jgi:hypothetical protein
MDLLIVDDCCRDAMDAPESRDTHALTVERHRAAR